MWREYERPALSKMREARRRARLSGCLLMGATALIASCGSSGPTDADRVERRSEFILASAPAGLAKSVTADSIAWAPGLFRLVGDEELEIDGTFSVLFRSLVAQPLELRYDLRFLDADGIFVDHFIPFGLPLLLEAGTQRKGEGTFTIRSRELAYPERLATMQVVASVVEPEE